MTDRTPRYADVLRLPGAVPALLSAVVGKVSFAMVSLALLLLVQGGDGGFALSGAVAGAFGIGNVVAAPLRARLVDRAGARPVLPALAGGYAAGLGALVLLPGGAALAVLVAVASGLLGTVGLVLAPVPHPVRTEAPARGGAARWVGPLRHARFWPVLLVLAAVGMVLGAVEILATAHGDAAGEPGLAGVLLACFAAGSVLGGLGYGAWNGKTGLVRRMILLGLAACLALLVLAAAGDGPLLLPLFALVGLFIAPSLVTGYLTADDVAPVEERTEASALINTAVNAGAALALAAGGVLLEESGTGPVIALLALSALAAVVAAALTLPFTRRGRRVPSPTGKEPR